jgi:hypothetical protein
MRKIIVAVLLVGAALLAGCGESIHWFPGNSGSSGGGTVPNPLPSGQTVTEVQADTVTKFLPYTVAFGNITTSTTTASITVSGDAGSNSMYSINNGTPTNAAGTVKKGDEVRVQNTSSNKLPNFSMLTTLNIGGAIAYYISKTGTLIFYTLTNQPLGQTVPSNWATVPASFTNNFVLGSQGTINFAADSDSSSTMYVNGNSTQSVALPRQINAGDTISFKHTTASTSNTTVTTKAILTGSSGTYEVTFKSVTQ